MERGIMRRFRLFFWFPGLICLGLCVSLQAQQRPAAEPFLNMPTRGEPVTQWAVTSGFPNIPFLGTLVGSTTNPVNGNILLYNLAGRVFQFPNETNAVLGPNFLDLTSQTFVESGFLNLVFHPEFGVPGSTNRNYFYVWYSHHPNPYEKDPAGFVTHTNRLSRFTVPDGSEVADPNSELILIQQEDRHALHAGGGMFFGTDGFLYLALSDEGTAYDSLSSAQQISENLFSGVIRIDVDMRGGDISHPIPRQPERGITAHYYIPNDNPWVGEPGVLEEFYAIGLRNPHRMSFDSVTGKVFIGDVGQGRREELNWLVKGANYQWPYMEGDLTAPGVRPAEIIGTEQPPILAYNRDVGICVIDGFVYRGEKHKETLGGKYIFGDVNGSIWALDFNNDSIGEPQLIATIPGGGNYVICSFMVDPSGEILVTTLNLGLARLNPVTTEPNFPATLSETGVFADASALEPGPSFRPYDVISPLWSDGALKRRWMSVPFDPEGTAELNYIGFTTNGAWHFPPGTIFVKHFDLQTNTMDPDAIRRVETRILVRQEDEAVYGVTYRWRPDGTEADAVLHAETEDIPITTPEGIRHQTWLYPGVNDCLTCHTPASGYVLGPNTRQLNHAVIPPEGGGPVNQIAALAAAGYFTNSFTAADLASLPSLVDPLGSEGSLHDRVRSYLDANCSHCHTPGGTRAQFDARFETPLHAQGLIQGLVIDNLGVPGSHVVTPRELAQSVLWQRVASNSETKMPPLARNVVDEEAVALIERWIQAMPELALYEPQEAAAVHSGSAQVQAATGAGEIPVSHIEFLLDGAALTNTPATLASFGLPELTAGEHELTAILHDAEGGRYTSSRPFVVDNSVPEVRIVNPATPVVPTTGFAVVAEAVPGAGRSIEELKIYLDGEATGEAAAEGWEGQIETISTGTHRLLVTAADDSGAIGHGSALFRAEHPPTLGYASGSTLPELLYLVRTNLAADIARVNDSPEWQGYPALPTPILTGLPDPLGGEEAIEIPPANLGGPDGYASGIYQVSSLAWPTNDPSASVAVSVWLRATPSGFPVSFGISAEAAQQVLLETNWQKFSAVFPIERCHCSDDFTVFQVFENEADGGAWQIAYPEVYLVGPTSLPFHAAQEAGTIERTEILLNGRPVAESLDGAAPPFQLIESGAFAVTARAWNNHGLSIESEPITLVAGPQPRLSWEGIPPVLFMKGFPGLPYEVQSSSNLVDWLFLEPGTLSLWKEPLPIELNPAPAQPNFFRTVIPGNLLVQ